jgi:hypothetical protein
MNELSIGRRVELSACSRCAPGTVTAVGRNQRFEVVFDDMPGTRWLLRAESLRVVEQLQKTTNRKELAL